MANYMVVETTLVDGAKTFSLQSTKDIQNGAIVGKGTLVDGEREIYTALDSYEDGVYLVANPAWSYDDTYTTNQNEENFINKAGKAFRVYGLKKDNCFTIYNVEETFEVGDKLKYDSATGKYVVDAENGNFRVNLITESGFPFCVGQYGVENGNYGYTAGKKNTKYELEYIG